MLSNVLSRPHPPKNMLAIAKLPRAYFQMRDSSTILVDRRRDLLVFLMRGLKSSV
jgi:hypothetical protein